MKTTRTRSRFSEAAFFLGILFHIFGLVVLVTASFAYGMGSFTGDSTSQISFTHFFLWIWTPLAMATWNPQESLHTGTLLGLSLISSVAFGIICGFLYPIIRTQKFTA